MTNTDTDIQPKGLLERLPLRPGTAAGVLAAATVMVFAEFVRSGFYSGYLTQVIDTRYHLPVAMGGLAWTTHVVADTLMRGPAGIAIQKYGPQRVVMAGAALSVVALSLLLLPMSTPLLLFAAALHGIGFSPVWPATMNLTADAAKPGYEGRTLTVVSTAVMPLSGLGFVIYGFLDKSTGQLPVLLAVTLLTIGLVLTTLLPKTRHTKAATTTDQAEAKPKASLTRSLLPLIPAALMQTLTQSLIGTWLFRIATGFGLSKWTLIAMLGFGGALAFAAMPRTGKMADGGKARLAVTLGYALVALGMGGFALMPPIWVLFICTALAGLGYAFLTPGWAALITQVLPEAQRPGAWGALMTVESAGFALGPVLGGVALGAVGARGPFVLGAGLALVTALGYIIFRGAFQPHGEVAAEVATEAAGNATEEPAQAQQKP